MPEPQPSAPEPEPLAGEQRTDPPETFCEIVAEHADTQPQAVAFIHGEDELTYEAIDKAANQAANALASIGVTKGDRIAFLGKNHPAYFELLIGAARLGAVMTPINWRLAAPEIAYVLGDCGASVVFVGDGFAGLLSHHGEGSQGLKHVIGIAASDHQGIDYHAWRSGFSDAPPRAAIGLEDDALQLYTSGTTGRPKGAVMTHGSILSSRDESGREGPLREWQESAQGDVTLLAMPCFHISGTGTGLSTLIAGTNAIILPEYDPTRALELIERYNISRIFLVPAALKILLDHPRANEVDFSRIKYVTYGASPIPLDLMREAMRVIGCGFIQMYGMTETSGTIVALDPEDHVSEGSPRMRGVGTPLPGVEIKIIDGEGNEVPANTVGEIATRSSKNMSRYWNMPEATAETIDAEGWLRTGDAGYLDADGYLYIHDRVKDMIISGGENVYPAEVENALYGHPAIADVAVIGVPDERWGEAVKACVVLKAGEALSEADIIAHARTQIAGYKCPKSVDFIESLPRNPSGKILRRELRAPYWQERERGVN